MSITFSPQELIRMALEIEKKGIAFYITLAGKALTPDLRKTFTDLADMERQHEETFRGMWDSDLKLVEQPEEYESYLKALLDNAVFPDETSARSIAFKIEHMLEAIDLAINAEKDSIVFYSYLLEVLPLSAASVVRRIIHEERKHFTQLGVLKKHFMTG